MREAAVGGRRIGRVDEVADPEAAIPVEQLGAAAGVERREGGVAELGRGRVGEIADAVEALAIPFRPRPLPLAVGGAVAVSDESAAGELDRPLLLGRACRAGPPERRQVFVEVGAQPQREPLDEPRRLVSAPMLSEPELGVAGARSDVDPGNPRIAAAPGASPQFAMTGAPSMSVAT